jgi:hypothetical protein
LDFGAGDWDFWFHLEKIEELMTLEGADSNDSIK